MEYLTFIPVSPDEIIEAGKKKGIYASSLRMRWWTLRARGELDFTSDYKIFRTNPDKVFQPTPQTSNNMAHWEYKREEISWSKLEESLNTAGKDGWELIIVIPGDMGHVDVIYKRKIINT